MTSRERIIRALNLEEVDKIPWIELGFHGKIVSEIIGEEVILNSGFHFLGEPEEYEKYIKQMIKLTKKIGLDALHLKCWAPTWTFIETSSSRDSIAFGTAGKIKNEKEFKNLEPEFIKNCEVSRSRILQCAEVFDRVMKNEEIARGYDIGGVFTESWESMGFENFCISMEENPELVKKVISLFGNFYNGIIEEVISKFKVDFVYSADDLAFKTSPFISLEKLREFIFPYFKETKKIIGDIPWILHCDGNILPIIEDLIEIGIKGFHPMEPQAINIFEVKKKYGDRICVIGNLDVDLIERGDKEAARKEIKKLVENLGYKGYIFSSGNSITEGAKLENILAIAEILNKKG
ncbi:hypothetical protein AUJ66_01140 [Candidatus Desantisbacteria bacterium CG1_02_38_46]|uniref:Uroporphyrinogen decarboxylase (URO-D) domain-containing protein n=3 Tax=unclassified Candidatus Desantisiibacteriota TaxID=3106372 RepID=A0A2H9PBF4_9BACT|nr:MAG: hypothetical protein AUJ66_01140 [Candidatus Desantisbacteria bacterium CG1_02_38_46]PIU51533.1 MAG: hypothetical protein COS91_03920 [Candidatus Desantisbacteria bacterium CG07_land_8_20_14_0_80_39_15]PIZ16073.1 MAG: hypothetical protein COY51_03570 [Candidatus Desantisbacteria bacterium CG_4_10_14_0_8_um_filter_39_17]